MIQQIDHLGIAVRDIDAALKFFEDTLGLTCEKREEVPSQMVKTAFLKVGEVHLELLEPTSAESPVARFLEKQGEGIHHLAFRVDDVTAQLETSKSKGVRLIHEVPITGAGDKWVAFLHPKSTHGVLTEFCQPKEPFSHGH